MRILRNLFVMSLFVFLVFGAPGAFAQDAPFDQLTEEQGGPMGPGGGGPGQGGPKGPSGHCSDSEYLYVIAQGKIFQYTLADLTLQATVDLPEPEVPEEPDAAEAPEDLTDLPEDATPPARRGGPSGAFIEGGFLYILHAGDILQYSTPDLVLQNSVTIEAPESE